VPDLSTRSRYSVSWVLDKAWASLIANTGSWAARTRFASSSTLGWNKREDPGVEEGPGRGPGKGSSGRRCVREASPANVVIGTLGISPFILASVR